MTAQPKPIWEGVYGSFAEANAETSVFEGTAWLDRVVARAEESLGKRTGASVPPVAVTTDYALPFIAAVAAGRERPLRILDFGGSMATSYVPLRAMLPADRGLDFVIVENETLCKKGNELFAGDPGVRFRSDLPPAGEKFDIVHFGSSLHYVDDWKGLLAASVALASEWLLFCDLPAADNRTFVTTQNFQGRRIPVRFWNVDEFVAAVLELGFDLLLKARYRGYFTVGDEAERPTSNFDEAHRLRYTSQLIFRRSGARSHGTKG